MRKHPHLWCPPWEPQTQNWIIFFWLGTTRFAESVKGLNIFSCSRWRVITKNVCASLLTFAVVHTLASGWFWGFLSKKHLNARGFAPELLRFSRFYRLGKRLKKRSKSSRLHSKQDLLCGGWGLSVSDVISGGLLGHLGPLCQALGTNR